MRRQIISLTTSLVLASLVSVAQSAEQRVYEWTDSNGVVHYSQFEPDSRSQARDVHTTSDPQPEPEKTPEQKACDIAKANQAMLASGKQVPLSKEDKNGDGQPDPMTEDEIKAAKDLAERQVQFFCKASPTASPD